MTASTLSQPYILLILGILGGVFGIFYILCYFFCTFAIKSRILGHILRIVYTLSYALAFFLCNLWFFDYNLHIYHYFICFATTFAIAFPLYLPLRAYNLKIHCFFDKLRAKLSNSKHIRRLLK